MAQKGKPFIEYVNGLPVEAVPDSGDAVYLGGDSSRRTNAGLFGGGGGEGGAVDSVNGFVGVVSLDADDIPDAATTNKFATQAQLDFVDSIVTDPTFDGTVTHDGATTYLSNTAGGGVTLTMVSDTANYIAFLDENAVSLGYIDVAADGNFWRFRNGAGDVFFQYDVGTGVVTFPDGGKVDASFDDPFDGTAPTATAFRQIWVPSDTLDGYIWVDTGDGIVANGGWVQFTSAASPEGLTLEQVRDDLATTLVEGSNITITHDDGADTITIASTATGGVTLEEVRDDLASVLTAGSNITITPNDGADTITIAAAASSVVATEVEVPFSSFAGADDDAKLAAFMSYAAAQTYSGITVLLDENRLYSFSDTQNLYDGFSIKGTARPQDQARASMPIGQRVDINVASNGWFALNQAQTFGCSFQGMSIDGNSTNRLVQGHASNVLWTSVFRDLSLQNIQNVLGSTTQKLLVTACTIDGFWNVNNQYDAAFNIGGSDFFFVPSTMLIDSEPAFRDPDSYLIIFNGQSNTHVKHLYMTCEEASGILIGSGGGNIWITDSVIEGRNNTDYCAGALIKHTGGTTVIRDVRLANAMADPDIVGGNGDEGVIHVSGGNVFVSGCIYEKQTTVAESVPFIYVTGSSTRVRVRDIMTFDHTWVGKPVVYQTQTGLVDADDSVTVVTA